VPAGTTFEFSVARRFDAMIRSATAVSGFATVEFIDTLRRNQVRATARIPINIVGGEPGPVTDTVTISAAKYTTRKQTLEIKAKSTDRTAVLTAWDDGTGREIGQLVKGALKITTSSPPATVKVTSDKGGSATATVQSK
jgi:hypothetical protein